MHDALEGRVKILLSKLDVCPINLWDKLKKYSKDCLNV